jgi:MGT family glycosyltransferase
MKNGHVAFVSVPIGSHLNQTLPLVETFTRRGYFVSYAVAEPFRARVEAAGATSIPLRLKTLTAQTVDQASFCRVATQTLAQITPFYESNRPALIVYDLTALAGRILAHRAGIPAVRTSPHFAMSRSALDQQIPLPAFRERVLAMSARADDFLKQHDIDEGGGFLFHREKLNIHLFPREFEPAHNAIDPACFHAGRSAGEQSGFGHWSIQTAQGRRVVLVAPSTSYLQGQDYFRASIEALSGLNWHVVISAGENPDPTMLESWPQGFEIVHRTSHTKILPHADLVICMGGMATGAEAAYHGVPMIITSRGHAELEWLGDNFVRLGIATHLRGATFTPEALRSCAVETLQNRALLDNVKRLQQSVRRSPGAEETVNRLEEYMQGDSRT